MNNWQSRIQGVSDIYNSSYYNICMKRRRSSKHMTGVMRMAVLATYEQLVISYSRGK